MTLVADASSLILLAKSDILIDLLKENKIMIPEKVYREIIVGKDKSREDAFLVERLISEHRINIVQANKKINDKIKDLFGLSGGEQEVISIAWEKNRPIITDDKKCFNAAKALKIEFITSPQIITILFKKNKITKHKALEAIESLEDFGWYKKEIIKNYREMIK